MSEWLAVEWLADKRLMKIERQSNFVEALACVSEKRSDIAVTALSAISQSQSTTNSIRESYYTQNLISEL